MRASRTPNDAQFLLHILWTTGTLRERRSDSEILAYEACQWFTNFALACSSCKDLSMRQEIHQQMYIWVFSILDAPVGAYSGLSGFIPCITSSGKRNRLELVCRERCIAKMSRGKVVNEYVLGWLSWLERRSHTFV